MNILAWLGKVRTLAAGAKGFGPNAAVKLEHCKNGPRLQWCASVSDAAKTENAWADELEVAMEKLTGALTRQLDQQIEGHEKAAVELRAIRGEE